MNKLEGEVLVASPTEQAKRVYIAYAQLNDLLGELSKRLEMGLEQKAGCYWAASASYAKSFNAILRVTRESFKFDEQFLESISEVTPIEEVLSPDILEEVLSRGSKLRGALQAFVNFYMSPKEKSRVGFHASSTGD